MTREPERPRPAAAPGNGLDDAYPPKMREEEDRLIGSRRRALDDAGKAAGRVGVALSGGGIRSATFCLGLFQGLATRGGLLRRIDFLSTVSGGGYFGGFLGRLAQRERVREPGDLERILTTDELPPLRDGSGKETLAGLSGVIRNLRENGRYLSPNGGGDLLLGGAVLFRNWLSLQVVLWSFALMGFLVFQALRVGGEVAAHQVADGSIARAFDGAGSVALTIWWSPVAWLALAVFAFLALPLCWSYWLVRDVGGRIVETLPGERGHRDPAALLRFLPTLIVGGAAGAWALFMLRSHTWETCLKAQTFWLAAALVAIPLLAVVYWLDARVRAERKDDHGAEDGPMDAEIGAVIFEDAAVRSLLSRRVRTALVTGAALLALALVDSLGQTLYVLAVTDRLAVASWVGGALGALTGVAGLGRRLVVRFGSRSEENGPRLSIPRYLLATVAALLVVAFLLVIVAGLSHAIAWGVRIPEDVTKALVAPDAGPPRTEVSMEGGAGTGAAHSIRLPTERFHTRTEARDLLPVGLGLGFFFLLTLVIGHVLSFVNRSSHHPLYTARLTRAYLGASNPDRAKPDGASVTAVLRGDDMNLEAYWPPPTGNGFPLHLINVTVNETVDGRSQVQQQDRKGTGMALGPAGLSLGIRHHVVGSFGEVEMPRTIDVFPEGEDAYRAFEYPKGYRGEPLTLGAWIGISGAAFTTGIGFRTSLGLALLAGLANVRLGYWWDSGVDPDRRRETKARRAARPGVTARWIAFVARVFPVQSFLIDELAARFPGTARRRWYLSDGGFFENLGGYELIRRRLPLMVIVDSTTDPDYRFGALANLVRKARLDFGAEIRFLEADEITTKVPHLSGVLGTLADLRRGRRESEGGDLTDDRTAVSMRHAALAEVRYEDGTLCRLLYLKPTITGDEPEDVLDYHRRHASFPQESTGDQFFDEAQWESYRRLGQHVAETIFRTAEEAAASQAPSGTADPSRLEAG